MAEEQGGIRGLFKRAFLRINQTFQWSASSPRPEISAPLSPSRPRTAPVVPGLQNDETSSVGIANATRVHDRFGSEPWNQTSAVRPPPQVHEETLATLEGKRGPGLRHWPWVSPTTTAAAPLNSTSAVRPPPHVHEETLATLEGNRGRGVQPLPRQRLPPEPFRSDTQHPQATLPDGRPASTTEPGFFRVRPEEMEAFYFFNQIPPPEASRPLTSAQLPMPPSRFSTASTAVGSRGSTSSVVSQPWSEGDRSSTGSTLLNSSIDSRSSMSSVLSRDSRSSVGSVTGVATVATFTAPRPAVVEIAPPPNRTAPPSELPTLLPVKYGGPDITEAIREGPRSSIINGRPGDRDRESR